MKPTQCTTLSEHEIHVWRFPLIAARQEMTALSHWLSEDENAVLDRIRSHARKDKRTVAWGRLRYILSRYLDCLPGDIEFGRMRFERPDIAVPEQSGIQFSLSHSGSFGLVAVSRNAVGVDIEKIDATLSVERLARRFFTPNEAEPLRGLSAEEKIETFFRLWVLKEAHLKSHGARIPAGLSQCEMALDANGVRLLKSDFESPASQNVLIEIPVTKGYVAALAGLQSRADISVFDL